MVTNRKGALQIPLLFAVFLITFSGLRIWGFLRNWRYLTETQLRLDRCVGEAAQQFRNSLNSLEVSNQRITDVRTAIKMAELEPWLIPPLQAVLLVQVAQQEWIRTRWEIKKGGWLLSQGCGKGKDTARPLPALDFIRDPPDPIGPQPLYWKGVMPQFFQFQVSHRPRHAAAKVERGQSDKISFESLELGSSGIGGNSGNGQWKANWSRPQKLGWASFP